MFYCKAEFILTLIEVLTAEPRINFRYYKEREKERDQSSREGR